MQLSACSTPTHGFGFGFNASSTASAPTQPPTESPGGFGSVYLNLIDIGPIGVARFSVLTAISWSLSIGLGYRLDRLGFLTIISLSVLASLIVASVSVLASIRVASVSVVIAIS